MKERFKYRGPQVRVDVGRLVVHAEERARALRQRELNPTHFQNRLLSPCFPDLGTFYLSIGCFRYLYPVWMNTLCLR